jgi:hypothetical protein
MCNYTKLFCDIGLREKIAKKLQRKYNVRKNENVINEAININEKTYLW